MQIMKEIQRLHALIQYCRINGLFGLAHSCEQILSGDDFTKLPRMVRGDETKVRARFCGQPIDQVYTEKYGWENCSELLDPSLVASVLYFNHNTACKVHFCGESVRGDYHMYELLEAE